jgi:hypothetical protein
MDILLSDEAAANMHKNGVLSSPYIEFYDNFDFISYTGMSVCRPVNLKSESSPGVGHLGFF